MIINFFIVTLAISVSCRDTPGKLASIFISYADTPDLEKAPPDTDFVFVLTRNGIRAPVSTCSNSFPNDVRYKTTWSKGLLTEEGKQLMSKVGRSLFTRYGDQVAHWPDGAIYVSSLQDNFASQSAEQLIDGLLYNCQAEVKKMAVDKGVKFDKTELFVNSDQCKVYDWMAYEVEKVDGPAKYANWKEFFDFLSAKVGAADRTQEWYVSSPTQVYWLWEVLEFESLSRHRQHSWVDSHVRRDILSTVREHYRELIRGNPDMPCYVVGRMFQEMINGFNDNKRKMHIHVTDSLSFAAFKSVLFDAAPEPPEFGETLMVEVYSDQHFRVHSFSPITSKFQKELSFKDFNINEQFPVAISHWSPRLGLPMKERTWARRCNDMDNVEQVVSRINQKYSEVSKHQPMTTAIDPQTHVGESRCVNYPKVSNTQQHTSILTSVADKFGIGKGRKQAGDNQGGDREPVDDDTQPNPTKKHHRHSSRPADSDDERGNERSPAHDEVQHHRHRESPADENQDRRNDDFADEEYHRHSEKAHEGNPSSAQRTYPPRQYEEAPAASPYSPPESDFTMPNPAPLPTTHITSPADDDWNTPVNHRPEPSWKYNIDPQPVKPDHPNYPLSQGILSAPSTGSGITESPGTNSGFSSSATTWDSPITETPKYLSPPSWESTDYSYSPPSGYMTSYALPSRDTAVSENPYNYKVEGLQSSNPTLDPSKRSVYDGEDLFDRNSQSPPNERQWGSGMDADFGVGLGTTGHDDGLGYYSYPPRARASTLTTYPSTYVDTADYNFPRSQR